MDTSMITFKKERESGFTLIEMAIVLVIVGIVISAIATVIPSLIKSSKIKKTRAIMEKVDYAIEGYIIANGRLPYADRNGDGKGDAGTSFGLLPFRDLGLVSGNDAWSNQLGYGVYSDLTRTNLTNLCTVLQSAATSHLNISKLYINQSGIRTNIAYLIVSGGARDIDGLHGFFDGKNGDNNPEYDDPARTIDTTYDDLMLATSFNEILGRQGCSGVKVEGVLTNGF